MFDVVFLSPDGDPLLNVERARFAIGKRLLVRLTVLSADGALVERQEFAGVLTSVDAGRGIQVGHDDGTAYWLPPYPRVLEEARPGEYRLHETGQTVVDPDYVTSWTIHLADGEHSLPPEGFQAG